MPVVEVEKVTEEVKIVRVKVIVVVMTEGKQEPALPVTETVIGASRIEACYN